MTLWTAHAVDTRPRCVPCREPQNWVAPGLLMCTTLTCWVPGSKEQVERLEEMDRLGDAIADALIQEGTLRRNRAAKRGGSR